MNLRKSLLLLMTLVLIAVLAACGGDDKKTDEKPADKPTEKPAEGEEVEGNDEWFPLVEETVDMNFFAHTPVQNEGNDWNDITIWNHYKELTNINVIWDRIDPGALEEQRGLALSGGTMPDAFYLAEFSNADLQRYGQEGVFANLTDLLEENAPNLTALMEKYPEIRKAITFPDGNIYSLPSLIHEDFLSVAIGSRPWINTEHIDEYFEGKMPQTTEEFYQFLTAIKEAAPAGADTIPYGGTSGPELVNWLAGSFGLANRGVSNAYFDADEDGGLRYFATSDEYKEFLTYLNKLYSEGLIDQQLFENDWGHFTALAGEGSEVFSSYVFYDPEDFFEFPEGQWIGMDVLEGPNGHKQFNKVASTVWDPANLVITSENPDPAAAVRWLDYFYSDEGSELYYMGVEGKTFERDADGNAQYVDALQKPEGGNDEQAIMKELTWIASINGVISADYFNGGEAKAPSMEATDRLAPYVPETIWPRFTFTEEENKVILAQGADVASYADQYRDEFITGRKDIDKEWDSYVEILNKSGLDKVIEVYGQAYDRYQE